MRSVFDISCRIASPTLIRRDILGHDAACTDNSSFAYCYRITNRDITANKGIFLYMYLPQPIMTTFLIRIKIMG